MNNSNEFNQLLEEINNDAISKIGELKNGFHDDLKQKGYSNRNIQRMMKPKKQKGSKYFFKK